MDDPAPDLQLKTDRPFQERFWFWERVGWGLMLLIALAALAGLTGASGPLASGRAEAAGATITYPRIARWRAADELSVEFAPGTGGPTEVLLPSAFIDSFSIESVTPQPAKVTATPDGQLYEFELTGSGRKHASFGVRPHRPHWPTRARGSVSGEPVEISFAILP